MRELSSQARKRNFRASGGNSADRPLLEKLALVDQLDNKERAAFYSVLDAFVGKKKLRDALATALKEEI